MLGEELVNRGGHWEVVFGGIAIANIPKNFEFDVDEIIKKLDLNPTEITDE